MKKWGKRILLGGAGLLAVIFGLIAWFLSASPKTSPVPQPNGADEVMGLAGRLPKMPGSPHNSEPSETEIRAWIASTPNFRSEITNLLKMEFLLRNTYSSVNSGNPLIFIYALRDLEKRLLVEAKDGNTPVQDKMSLCLQAYELGSRATQGGALLDGIVSTGGRVKSLETLVTCSSNATGNQLQSAANRLHQLVRQAPKTKDYLDGEKFFEASVPLRAKVASWFDRFRDFKRTRLAPDRAGSLEATMSSVNQIELQTVRDLAVRSYTMDKGSAPTGWSDLIPAYLPDPLVDPVGKTNLSLIPGKTYKLSTE